MFKVVKRCILFFKANAQGSNSFSEKLSMEVIANIENKERLGETIVKVYTTLNDAMEDFNLPPVHRKDTKCK